MTRAEHICAFVVIMINMFRHLDAAAALLAPDEEDQHSEETFLHILSQASLV